MNGRLAMFMSSRREVPNLRSIEDFDWDVAPIPSNGEPANVLHSDAFCLTAASDRHDEAWAFAEFVLGREGQEILAATGRTVPSRIAVAESPVFLDPSLPPSRSQVFLDAIPHIRRLPTLSTWPEIEDISNTLIEEAMYDPVPGEIGELVTSLRVETADAFGRAGR
jgi:multiple sugar transport system substrate-binding protein